MAAIFPMTRDIWLFIISLVVCAAIVGVFTSLIYGWYNY
jgi:hypothetical protein